MIRATHKRGIRTLRTYRLGCASLALLTAAAFAPAVARAQAAAGKSAPTPPTVTTGDAAPQPASPVIKIKRAYNLALGLRDGDRYIGDVQSTINPDGTVAIDTAQALALLRPVLDAASFAKLEQAIAGEKTAPLADFAKGGVPTSFDETMLQIVLSISPTARVSQDLQVANLDHALIGGVAQPEAFSGYLNMRGSADFVEKGSDKGLGDPLLLLDGAVRAHGLVLEGEGQYAPGQSGTDVFSRQGTRLVYDDTDNLIRWTAGDLQVQTDGFQGTPDMAGLSVLRLYDQLAPQENVRPRGNRTFTLQRASTVQTFVNGQPVQQVRLAPGTYDASNFPFVQGANDVNLVITDDAGTRETLNFSIFFDRSLLKPGLTEFGAFAGVNSTLVDGSTRYPDAQPLFSGFIRHGFGDTLTAGANLQANSNVQMAGASMLWGSPIGTIGLDLAGSRNKSQGSGYALNLNYELLNQEQGDFRSQTIDAAFEMRSKDFSTLDQDASSAAALSAPANNPYKWQGALTYGRAFGQYSFAQLQASYAAGRAAQGDVGSITGTIGYGITENANVNFNVGYAIGGFQKGMNFGVQLTYRMGETANLRGEYQSKPQTERLSYENSTGRGDGAWSVSGSVDHTADALDFNGAANYSANRAELGIAHTSTYGLNGTHVDDERTALQAGASIAFAGGSVAIGRPIFDSFALFDPHPTLNGAPVLVDPGPTGDLARSDVFGPAVLNDLGSYSLRTVTYDVPSAPPGYDIGTGALRVLPPYHSGYRVEVGSDYSMLVVGRLLNENGAPIPLLAGKAVELDVPNGRTVPLFTSRDGRFGAQGLRSGHWRIEMPGSPPVAYDITIEKTAQSLLRVGDLKPLPTETK